MKSETRFYQNEAAANEAYKYYKDRPVQFDVVAPIYDEYTNSYYITVITWSLD